MKIFGRATRLAPLALTFCTLPAVGLTVFSGSVSTDFNDAANWSNGVPNGANAAARINATSVLTSTYDALESNLIVGRGANVIYDTSLADEGFLRLDIIPEPSTSLLVGLAGFELLRRRR